MVLRYVLIVLLLIVVARAFWRLIDGVLDGWSGGARRSRGSAAPGVAMVRDPVCGTFVLPDRAITVVDGSQRLHFCSPACRDKYRARTA